MYRIHKEGIKILIIVFVVLTAINLFLCVFLLEFLIWKLILSFISLLFFLAVVSFFRNPNRFTDAKDNEVIAPADGKIVVIEETEEKEYFQAKKKQLSIFMSPANVHVNRTPVGGEVKYVKYHKGNYLVAWHPKSSIDNEHNTIVISNGQEEILFRQIAGFMARRIVCYLKGGEVLKAGDEIGFIRFGSRVDVFIPVNAEIKVALNENVKGGKTVLAILK
ncbi:MAG: phosphatidylserine decarboxylase family protein [Chitinophagales bacterium]|nr:phosphatidylserine decarboxylase family protein [Chitinophagales bacterium]